MKIKLLDDCREDLPKNCRLMGLDLGAKTIGIAICNADHSIVTPIGTVNRTKFSKDILELAVQIKDFEIGGFILGWPLNMDGSRGARCDAVLSFADEMRNHPDIFGTNYNGGPFIALWDERLSTQLVDRDLDNRVDIGKKRKQSAKTKGLKDALAAQIILQRALDPF